MVLGKESRLWKTASRIRCQDHGGDRGDICTSFLGATFILHTSSHHLGYWMPIDTKHRVEGMI